MDGYNRRTDRRLFGMPGTILANTEYTSTVVHVLKRFGTVFNAAVVHVSKRLGTLHSMPSLRVANADRHRVCLLVTPNGVQCQA